MNSNIALKYIPGSFFLESSTLVNFHALVALFLNIGFQSLGRNSILRGVKFIAALTMKIDATRLKSHAAGYFRMA